MIEYFRITDQQVTWDDSFAGMLEAGLASAVGLLALEVLSDALSWIKKKAEQLNVNFEWKNGRTRGALGWGV